MKIVAEVSRDRQYLIEISADELANLLGFRSMYAVNDERAFPGIGREVAISAMYQRLNKLSDERDRLHHTAEALRGLAVLLETFDPVVKLVTGE